MISGILFLEQIDNQLPHRTFQLASMLFLETLRIGEPSDQVTQRPDRKTDDDILVFQIKIVFEKRLFLSPFPDLEPEIDEILFGAGDPTAFGIAGKKDIAGIGINDLRMPLSRRKKEAGSVIEVVQNPCRTFLRRHFGRHKGITAALVTGRVYGGRSFVDFVDSGIVTDGYDVHDGFNWSENGQENWQEPSRVAIMKEPVFSSGLIAGDEQMKRVKPTVREREFMSDSSKKWRNSSQCKIASAKDLV